VPDPRHSSEGERFVLPGISRGERLIAVMFADRDGAILISAARLHDASAEAMKKTGSKANRTQRVHADEILPEYDFSKGQHNKYASRYAAGSSVVVLEPDVAAAFPTSGEANDALRALAAIIQKHRPHRVLNPKSPIRG